MQVKTTQRTKWRGKTTIVPVFAGMYKAPDPGDGPIQRTRIGDKEGETITIRTPGGDLVLVSVGAKRECTTDTFRRAGGTIAKWLARRDLARAGVDAQVVEASQLDGGLGALCEGLVLGAFRFDEHKSDPKPHREAKVDLLVERSSAEAKDQVRRAMALCQAVNYARAVAHQPPNVLNPVTLADRCRQLASDQGLKCTVLDEKQMKRLDMGAILAVGQGSATPPRLIVLEYAGSGGGKPIAMVGKAVTFDTGGYSIKTKDGILGMKYDKCGGTAVLGIMQAVASLKPETPVVGIIAAAENMICGGAYRPDDIITTMSGKTVEIVSADAEGRLVLCDALTYVQRKYQPRTIIDLATLTGGVVVALGKHRAGLFCNHDQLRDALLASGDRTHERLWPMPIDDEYLEALEGDDSDLKNSGGREAHAILGAMFLKQFVDAGTPWAHLDIAGVADVDKDQPYCPKGGTGFGVRLLADYVERSAGSADGA